MRRGRRARRLSLEGVLEEGKRGTQWRGDRGGGVGGMMVPPFGNGVAARAVVGSILLWMFAGKQARFFA